MLAMLPRVRALLDAELRPDGYNIGINDGAAAGQTVMHVHLHVIPRYRGDRPDLGGKMRAGCAGSFRRRPTIGAAGANDRSARRPGAYSIAEKFIEQDWPHSPLDLKPIGRFGGSGGGCSSGSSLR
jgi:diadenosine tetraphosphate (Ap4A) HIT family hydrolase